MDSFDSLADRVKWLVQDRAAGSVNGAAKAWEVPQRTLHRIVNGEAKNPPVTVVQRIAEQGRAKLEWLLTGEGEAPAHSSWPRPFDFGGSTTEWFRIVGSLNLPPELSQELRGMVSAPIIAGWLHDYDPGLEDLAGPTRERDTDLLLSPITAAAMECQEALARAWSRMFRVLIERMGVEKVRAVLMGARPFVLTGFHPRVTAWLESSGLDADYLLSKLLEHRDSPLPMVGSHIRRKAFEAQRYRRVILPTVWTPPAPSEAETPRPSSPRKPSPKRPKGKR